MQHFRRDSHDAAVGIGTNKRNAAMAVLLSCGLLTQAGCMAAAMAAPSLAVGAAQMLSESNQRRFADVEITPTPRYNRASVERVAFISPSSGLGEMNGITATFTGFLTSEFLREGFDVVENSRLQTAQAPGLNPYTREEEPDDTLEMVATDLGVEALFRVSAQSEADVSMGFLGVGADATVGVIGATLRMIDVDTGSTTLIITANYKRARSAKDVASDMAGAFREFLSTEPAT